MKTPETHEAPQNPQKKHGQKVDYAKIAEQSNKLRKINVESDDEALDEQLENAYDGGADEKQLDKALRERGLKGMDDVMGKKTFEGQKYIPGENVYETYKNFDFSKIVKDGKFLPGVEKQDAIGRYIEIGGRKFYDANYSRIYSIDEPMFTYYKGNYSLQLQQQIGSVVIGKGLLYGFSDGNKSDFRYGYSKEEIMELHSKEYPAIIKYLEKLEGKGE